MPKISATRRRSALRRIAAELRYAIRTGALPARVAWFHWRARRLAWRTGDVFSLTSATRPTDLALLLKLARGRRRVAELGTATAWTAIALALADRRRRVVTYDPVATPERERYLGLVGSTVRARIELVTAAASVGPPAGLVVDLLYVDSSHLREDTIAELRAWWPALAPGALVVLDDYAHPDFPGVHEAVDALGLLGQRRGTLFVHELRAA